MSGQAQRSRRAHLAHMAALARPDPGREHDLPPSWDGHRVTWGEWAVEAFTSLIFHLPIDASACVRCGVVGERMLRCLGTYSVGPTAWCSETDKHGTTRTWPVRSRLAATRCPECAHDQVLDLDSGDLFDLEASDYAASGSIDVREEALW